MKDEPDQVGGDPLRQMMAAEEKRTNSTVTLDELAGALSRALNGAEGIAQKAVAVIEAAPEGSAVRAGMVKSIIDLFAEKARQDGRGDLDYESMTDAELEEMASLAQAELLKKHASHIGRNDAPVAVAGDHRAATAGAG